MVFVAIWIGVLQSPETVEAIVQGELPEVVLGCYILSAFYLLSPYVSDRKESKTPSQITPRVSKSWLPIRLRLLLSMSEQQVVFGAFLPLLSSIGLLITYWLGLDYMSWGICFFTLFTLSIGGLLPNRWHIRFQAKPELFERLAFTLAINPHQAQRQLYQSILTLFFIVVAISAVPMTILAIVSNNVLVLGGLLFICTAMLLIDAMQHQFEMFATVVIITLIGLGAVMFFTLSFSALPLTILASLYFFASLGYCYFKPPQAPFSR